MNAPVIVPDASVLLKWSLDSRDEEARDQALDIRRPWLSGQHRIVLPPMWVYEVGNTLGTKQPDLARDLLEICLGYRFDEESAATLCGATLGVMRKIDVSLL